MATTSEHLSKHENPGCDFVWAGCRCLWSASGFAYLFRLVVGIAFCAQHATLLQVNGPRVLIALAIPVVIALVPVLLPKWWVRIVAGLLLAVFVVIAGFSIGLFLLPERFHHAYGRLAINAYAETVTVHKPSNSLSLVRCDYFPECPCGQII